MENLKNKMRNKVSKNKVQIKVAITTLIQPYNELPCDNNGQDGASRINPHDLFSFFTADIIKEDIVFIR
jgi:hypothetical protein